jgi:hypothetical protein
VLCPAWNTRDAVVAAAGKKRFLVPVSSSSSCRKKRVSSTSELVLDHSNWLWGGSKSIDPFPNYLGADGPILLSLACAPRNTPGMGIGVKGNEGRH